MNASDEEVRRSSERFERVATWSGVAVLAGLVVEVGIAIAHPPYDSFLENWGAVIADSLVALGVGGEVLFGKMGSRLQSELTRRSNDKLSKAIDRATALETNLRPREINQEQWVLIQGLSEHFDWINIVCETDAETKFLVKSLSDAFFTAGIGVALHGVDPGLHSVGVLVYEPKGFDGARPKSVGPLIDMLQKSAATMPVNVVTGMPGYAALPIAAEIARTGRGAMDAPAIIVGGRFILPPAYWAALAKPVP